MAEIEGSGIKRELATLAAAFDKLDDLVKERLKTEPTCSCSGTAKSVIGFDMDDLKGVCKACAVSSHTTVPVGGTTKTALGIKAADTIRQEVIDAVIDAANDPITVEDLVPAFIDHIGNSDTQPGTGPNFRGNGAPKTVHQAVRARNKSLGSMNVDVNRTFSDAMEPVYEKVVKTDYPALNRFWTKAKAARISREKLAPIIAAALALQDPSLDN